MIDDPWAYRDIIIDHGHHPRHKGLLKPADIAGEGANPDRGDVVKLTLRLADGAIREVGFESSGSTVLTASCSLLGDVVCGLTPVEAQARAERLIELVTGPDDNGWDDFGEAEALRGIKQNPARVQCGVLPWRTLIQVLSFQA